MWLIKALTVFVVCSQAFSASVHPCPHLCKCNYVEKQLTVKCNTFDFLKNTSPEQLSSIHSLDLSNASVKTIDKRLKLLEHLEILDLSNNTGITLDFLKTLRLKVLKLKHNNLNKIVFRNLPKTLEDLDISFNSITHLSKDWNYLKSLKFLHIYGNPIDCDHDSVLNYENLINAEVKISEKVICHLPKRVKEHTLQSVIADKLLNMMVRDEPTQDEDTEDDLTFMRATDNPKFDSASKESDSFTDHLFEGSGDEGSGDSETAPPPQACVFNCSTFGPVDGSGSDNAPLISIKDQFNMVFEDLFESESSKPTSEKPARKENGIVLQSTKDAKGTPETNTNHTEVGKIDKASLGNEKHNYTFYLIGTVVVLMIAVIIFVIIKRRSRAYAKRRNSANENGICEEMKPMGKYADKKNGVTADKPVDSSAQPEHLPLINGQNEEKEDDYNKPDLSLDDVLRIKPMKDSLTPSAARVTITASELPDSIPKTPQLVHRERNSEGEIVTRAVSS